VSSRNMDEQLSLIRRLDHARQNMRMTLVDLDPNVELYPAWTIKHILAHIAGWDDATTSSLRAHAGGREPPTPAASGIDEYNAHSVETREVLNYRQVVFASRLLVKWTCR